MIVMGMIIKFMQVASSQTCREIRFRSVKYKISRGSSFLQGSSSRSKSTFNQTLFPQTSRNSSDKAQPFSKLTPLNTTLYCSKVNPEDRERKDNVYLRTHKLARERNLKQGQELERVALPQVQEGESYFTVLDNINLPIDYLRQEIGKVSRALGEEVPKIQQIGSDLKALRKNGLEKLDEMEKSAVEGFQRLRSMLHVSKASQHTFSLRIKRELKDCGAYLPDYYQSLDQTKRSLTELQTTIFSQQPFELHKVKMSQDGEKQVFAMADYF